MALRALPGESKTFTLSDLHSPGVGPITSATVVLTLRNAAGTSVASGTATSGGTDDWSATLTMPTTTGVYTLEASVNGTTTPELTQLVEVGPVLATRGVTRRELRRRVGDLLGDLDWFRATASLGTLNTFKDDQRLIAPDNHYLGRIAYVARGHANNVGAIRFVAGSSFTARTLTLDPALPNALVQGDEVELWMKRGTGFLPTKVNDAIDRAIQDAGSMGGVPLGATITAAFDADTGTLSLPSVFDTIHLVEYQPDADEAVWVEVPLAPRAGGGGWWATGLEGTLQLGGVWRDRADGATVRVWGTGRLDSLEDEEDRTEVNPEWVAAKACEQLLLGGLGVDPQRERTVGVYLRKVDQLRQQAVPVLPPGSVEVR